MKSFFLATLLCAFAATAFAQQQSSAPVQQVRLLESGAWQILKPIPGIPAPQQMFRVYGLITDCPVVLHKNGSITISENIDIVFKIRQTIGVQSSGNALTYQVQDMPDPQMAHLSNDHGDAYAYFIAKQQGNIIQLQQPNGDVFIRYINPVFVKVYYEFNARDEGGSRYYTF